MNARVAIAAVLAAAAPLLLGGCATAFQADFKPPVGGLVTRVRAPLSTDFADTPVCEQSGSASTYYFHEPLLTRTTFAWSDCSVAKAAANGQLRTVRYADYEFLQVLGVFGQMTVTAYGER